MYKAVSFHLYRMKNFPFRVGFKNKIYPFVMTNVCYQTVIPGLREFEIILEMGQEEPRPVPGAARR